MLSKQEQLKIRSTSLRKHYCQGFTTATTNATTPASLISCIVQTEIRKLSGHTSSIFNYLCRFFSVFMQIKVAKELRVALLRFGVRHRNVDLYQYR